MRCATILAISMVSLVPSTVEAKAPTTYPPAWGQDQTSQPTNQTERQHVRHYHSGRPSRIGPTNGRANPAPSEVVKLQADIAALRRELADIKAEVGAHPAERVEKPDLGWVRSLFSLPMGEKRPVEPTGLPNLSTLPQLAPSQENLPVPSQSRLRGIEAVDEVREARLYLIKTATIGLTMARQGPEIAIGRLHPEFAIKLAAAIKRAREAGLEHCGIFSAYGPPAFGVGGFSDKFNSLHSYGLAADIAGIGGPGSKLAKLWQNIVWRVGLFLPYGPNNRAEFNHTQLISNKVAASRLRGTITSHGPKDLERMWLASGVATYVEPEPRSSVSLLPTVDWHQ
jgi:hypothetical protein